jgi:hypothetical protein
MNDDEIRTMLRQIDAERAAGLYGQEVGTDGQPIEGGQEINMIDILDKEDAAQAAEREKPAPETAQQRNERIR